jgi:hypothetical protein
MKKRRHKNSIVGQSLRLCLLLYETKTRLHDKYRASIRRDDKKEAYIKYNKLIIDGKIYTDGKYGSVA